MHHKWLICHVVGHYLLINHWKKISCLQFNVIIKKTINFTSNVFSCSSTCRKQKILAVSDSPISYSSSFCSLKEPSSFLQLGSKLTKSLTGTLLLQCCILIPYLTSCFWLVYNHFITWSELFWNILLFRLLITK